MIDWGALHARLETLSDAIERRGGRTEGPARQVLKARARELAQATDWRSAPAPRPPAIAVVFSLAGERFALAADHVLEVVRIESLTPVPGEAGHLIGLVSVRGRLAAAISLETLLGLTRQGIADLHHALLLAPDGQAAFVVETAIEAAGLPEELSPPPPGRPYLKGVAATAGITVLDGPQLLADPRVAQAVASAEAAK